MGGDNCNSATPEVFRPNDTPAINALTAHLDAVDTGVDTVDTGLDTVDTGTDDREQALIDAHGVCASLGCTGGRFTEQGAYEARHAVGTNVETDVRVEIPRRGGAFLVFCRRSGGGFLRASTWGAQTLEDLCRSLAEYLAA